MVGRRMAGPVPRRFPSPSSLSPSCPGSHGWLMIDYSVGAQDSDVSGAATARVTHSDLAAADGPGPSADAGPCLESASSTGLHVYFKSASSESTCGRLQTWPARESSARVVIDAELHSLYPAAEGAPDALG